MPSEYHGEMYNAPSPRNAECLIVCASKDGEKSTMDVRLHVKANNRIVAITNINDIGGFEIIYRGSRNIRRSSSQTTNYHTYMRSLYVPSDAESGQQGQ